jgi:hypothetical protein
MGHWALGIGHKNNFGFWIADFGLDFNLKSKICLEKFRSPEAGAPTFRKI